MTVRVEGNLALVDFGRPYDLEGYGLFLKAKQLPESQLAYDPDADRYTLSTPARFAPLLGGGLSRPEAQDLPLAPHLFDFQRWAVQLALEAERFALWADTGLGKTACLLEWTRQVQHRTGGKVLIVCPLALIGQHQREAAHFYGEDNLYLHRVDSREALVSWLEDDDPPPVAITNYEKFIPGVLPELRHLSGIVLDESSLLKTGGGVIKWNLIKSARGIPYKLSCTATPAPNEAMEYASQASFLEKLRTEGEILWTYFTKTEQGYIIKPHARAAFYASSVSRALVLGMAMVAQRARGVVASVYAGEPAGTAVIQGRTVTTKAGWILSIPPRQLSAFIADDGGWKKVRTVTEHENTEVWDLQVAEDHSFVAEGCSVHNCPLQLEVIRRLMKLYSNPGDLVLDPFMGIGSTASVAIELGRHGVGFELKESYHLQAQRHVREAIAARQHPPTRDLFSDLAAD